MAQLHIGARALICSWRLLNAALVVVNEPVVFELDHFLELLRRIQIVSLGFLVKNQSIGSVRFNSSSLVHSKRMAVPDGIESSRHAINGIGHEATSGTWVYPHPTTFRITERPIDEIRSLKAWRAYALHLNLLGIY